jgi:wobble nucleotide-excising tRNase
VITKIIKLIGIGTLHEPLPSGTISLRKKTVIFGENGRGKSTFVAILRSLGQGTGEVLRGRRTIGGKHEPVVEFLVGSQKHLFQQGTWNQGHESISIFDATFVAENVYTGNSVDTDQRKNLLSFALGATGVKLAQEVDDLVTTISNDGKAEREAATKLQSHVSGQMSLEVFAELPEPSKDSETDLADARSELAAQKQASTVRNLQSLSSMSFDGPQAATLTDVLEHFL